MKLSETYRVAAKNYSCLSCGRIILSSNLYSCFTHIYDGKIITDKYCLICRPTPALWWSQFGHNLSTMWMKKIFDDRIKVGDGVRYVLNVTRIGKSDKKKRRETRVTNTVTNTSSIETSIGVVAGIKSTMGPIEVTRIMPIEACVSL